VARRGALAIGKKRKLRQMLGRRAKIVNMFFFKGGTERQIAFLGEKREA